MGSTLFSEGNEKAGFTVKSSREEDNALANRFLGDESKPIFRSEHPTLLLYFKHQGDPPARAALSASFMLIS